MARADAKYSVTLEDKTQQALRRIQGNVGKVDDAFSNLAKGVAGLGAAVGVGGLVAFTRQSIEQAAAMGRVADMTGLTVETYQVYRNMLRDAGIDQSEFDGALEEFVIRMGEAKVGVGSMHGALKDLDESVLKYIVSANDQDEALRRVFESMAKTTDATKRSVIADAAFSGGGVRFARVAKDGAEALREQLRAARELYPVIGEDGVKASQRAEIQMARFNAVFSGLSTTFATNLAGPLADVVQYFNEKIPTAVNYTKASYASLAYVVTTLRQGLNIISFDFDEAEALGKQADRLMEMYRSSLAAAEGTSKLEDAQERLIRRVAEITSDIENAKGRIESYGDVRPGDQFYDVVRRDQMLIEAYQQDLSNVRAELERTKSALAAAGSNTMLTGDDSGPSIEAVQNRRVEAMRAAVVQMADLDMEWSSIARQQSQIRIDTVRREESEKAEARDRGIALLGDMGILMNSESRKMFELGKAASTAHAIISGIEAVQDAYKWGQKWGGPPLGAAFASAAALVTAARVQQIRSVQFTGGGSAANSAVGNAVPGGAGPGGAAGTLTPIGQSEPQTQRVTNVYISGYIDTAEGRRVLGDIFRDLDRDDVVFLSANGANAQAIRSGV